MTRILQYLTDQHVRRLAWCLLSEPMAHIDAAQALDLTHWQDLRSLETWLQQLDEDPAPLHQYIESGNHRLLGSYFERLWQFFFSHCPGWTLLADHIQIIDGKQTLGELDLIILSPHGEVLHVELATKWYLQIPTRSGRAPSDWLGPQTKDRLDLKIKKLIEKQFPFAYDPIVTKHLNDHGIPLPDQQRLIMKGALFHQLQTEFQLPDCSTSMQSIYPWCHQQHLHLWMNEDHHYCLLEKHQWLGPMRTSASETYLSYQQLLDCVDRHFKQSKYPYALMICDLGTLGDSPNEEQRRIMVVHKHWPLTYQSNK